MDYSPAITQSGSEKVFILGPCSAESPEQLRASIEPIKDLKPHLIRAGIWKPRTRPGKFQGQGEQALEWLIELKNSTGIPVCTEVANTKHVEACLKFGIDVVWIGARTTVNPFYVQEIAESLKGVDIPVMIKNPMNPDLFLWLGAIERMLKSGIQKIAAIHRGFSFYGNSIYRNVPRWQIPLELTRQLPGIQLIADISHISGNPQHHLEIAQIAMDLNYNGLMVEIHHNPDIALSDADQQVTPDFFRKEILHKLIQRKPLSDSPKFHEKITSIRKKIDVLDQQLLQMLSLRMKLAEEIGLEKKKEGISILQPDRWNEIVVRLTQLAQYHDLSEEFIMALIEAIHIESIHHQSHQMNQ